MVSPATPNKGQDPWNLTVEDVVALLCDGNGFLKKQDPTSQYESFNLGPILRAHQICGSILLTKIDEVCLRNELGMNSIGERGYVEIIITQLRDQSLKYREHLQARFNTTTPFASYGAPSGFNPASEYSSRFHAAPGQYNTLMAPPTMSPMNPFLLELMRSPDNTPQSIHSLYDGTPFEPSSAEKGNALLNQTTHSPLRRPGSDVAQNDPLFSPQALDHQVGADALDTQRAENHSSRISHPDNMEDLTPHVNGEIPEIHAEIISGLRHGETYVLDDSGRKRRRLRLNPSNMQSDLDTSKTNDGGNAQSPDQQTPVEVTNTQNPHDLKSISIDRKPTLNGILGTAEVDQDLTTDDRVEAPAEVFAQEVQEPGKLIIEAQGRKRMRPLLVSQLSAVKTNQTDMPRDRAEEQDDQLPSSSSVSMLDLPTSTVDPKRSRSKRGMHHMYLGPGRHLVDEIFYGDTPMDQEVQYNCHDEESFQFSYQSELRNCRGKEIYVHNRIKHFLLNPRIESFRRNGQIFTSIIPYPETIGKKYQCLSLTLLKNSDSGIKAYRVDRLKWFNLHGRNHDPDKVPQGLDKMPRFVIAESNSLLDQLGENQAMDWEVLKKWECQESASDVLPLYGDSGSENELDLDTWREIEEERGALDRPLAPTRRKKITLEEVNKAIDEASRQMIVEWTNNKLPRLEGTAWRIWTKSRRDKTKRDQITFLSQATDKLNIRLAKIRKELTDEVWSSAAQVKKQCQCMHASIFDRENNMWKTQVLEMRSAPNKPTGSNEQLNVKTPKGPPVSLEEDEEDLTADELTSSISDEDGLDDFIDDGDLAKPLILDDTLDYANDAIENDETMDDADLNFTTQVTSPADIEDDSIEESRPKRRQLHLPDSSDMDVGDRPLGSKALGPALDDETDEPLSELSPSPDLTSELKLSSALRHTAQTVESSDIIDLTQHSSSPITKSPKPKREQYRIRTPPLFQPDEDPFARDRKADVKFKVPPMPSNIIDIESTSASSEENDLVSTPKKLPELWETVKIGRLSSNYLQERQDRKRLLIWIIYRMQPEHRRQMITQTTGQDSASLRDIVWECMKKMKSHGHRLRGYDEDDSSGYMRLANLYITWTKCMLSSEEDGVLVKNINIALEDRDGFELFCSFLKETLRPYQKSKSSFSGLKTTRKKKKEEVEGSSDEPLYELGSSPHKKRKSKVPESQEALVIRQNALDRVRDTKIRSKQMEARLRSMGVNSQDISTMAINMGASAGQDLIPLNPKIGTRIQPHQSEGVRFMWGEIINKQGCLLAHTMGLGKTMQVITLLVTIAEASKSSNENVRNQVPEAIRESRTLVLCPPSLIDNWYDEFLMWTPKPRSNNVGELHKVTSSIGLPDRLYEIQEWSDNGGVLLLGYSTFRDLISNKTRKGTIGRPLSEEQHRKVLDQLLQRPNIVVADEAHALKARASEIAHATKRFRTESRIALTGSPLANNLEEYFAVIDWVAPKYLGDLTEFRSRYVEPITDGLFRDSSAQEKRKGLKMLEVLTRQLQPKVHRADISVLKGRLPGKTEFVIRVPLTDIQEQAYKIYVTHILAGTKSNEPAAQLFLVWFSILRLLCNHPKCFIDRLNENKKALKKNGAKRPEPKKVLRLQGEDLEAAAESLMEASVSELGLPEEMLVEQRKLFENLSQDINSIQLAHKMQLLMQVLDFSEEAGDKVLVFSHSIPTLDYIEQILRRSKRQFERLDGKTRMSARSDLTKEFNSGDSKICLVSTRAGGQGFNLFGANRVVIIDDNFNPMHEQQAIGRAYRLGQQKHVYVYRLTVGGTFEEAMQNQSLFKLQLATRVVDKKNPMRNALKGVRRYLFSPKNVEQQDITQFQDKDELVLDRILASQEKLSIIRSIDLSETLHQEVFEELTADEKREVKEMEEDEMLRRTNPQAYRTRLEQRERERFQQQKQILNTLRREEAEASGRTSTVNGLQPHLENGVSSAGLMPILADGTSFSPGGSNLSNIIPESNRIITEGSYQTDLLPADNLEAAKMNLSNRTNSLPSHPDTLPLATLHLSKPTNLDGQDESEDLAVEPVAPFESGDPNDRPIQLNGEARNHALWRKSPSVLYAPRTSSETPGEVKSLLGKDTRNIIRQKVAHALSKRLPILSQNELFSSSRGPETCHEVAKGLERLAAKRAKDQADYKKIINTHTSTCLDDDGHLADLLKATEEKKLSNSSRSTTLSQPDLSQTSDSEILRYIRMI